MLTKSRCAKWRKPPADAAPWGTTTSRLCYFNRRHFCMKILLLQLKRIGDLILTTPAIAALREKFPGVSITFVVSRECEELLPAIAGVDRTLVTRRNLRDVTMFFAVAREKFDYCIDFTRNDRSALLAFLSGAQKRVVSHRIKVQSKSRAGLYNEFARHRMREMHTLDYHLALLEPLGIDNASPALQLELPRGASQQAEKLRRDAKIGNSFIIFHPGSARVEKFWETQRWADVIDQARRDYDVDLVLTGGTSEVEQEHIREIKAKLRQPIIDLSGKTDLLTLTALIEQARLLVTVDSAPMHLAAATQTPQVVLFGPTNPFHWRPRESPALILQGDSPTPVLEFSPDQARVPMKQISTEAVIGAMDSLLSAPAVQIS
jgi:predicted lipopolysaccharide heptosyltransferase III